MAVSPFSLFQILPNLSSHLSPSLPEVSVGVVSAIYTLSSHSPAPSPRSGLVSALTISTKRVVRRRLRKGAMTPGGSRTGGGSFGNVMGQGSAIGSALRAMNFKKSKSGGDPTQSHLSKSSKRGQGQSSQVGSRSQSGSSTPIPPPRHGQQGYPSILQELRFVGDDADTPRKGSWATSEGKEVDLSRAGQGQGQGH